MVCARYKVALDSRPFQ